MSYVEVGIAHAIVAVLAGWMLANSRYHIGLRALCISGVVVLALASWLNLSSLFGYAVGAIPPNNSILYGEMVDGHRAIYIWAIPPGDHAPRSYQLPYSDALARTMAQAQQAMNHGGIVRLQTGHAAGGHHGAGTAPANGHPGGIRSSQQGPNITVTMRPLLPEKSGPDH